MYFSHNLSIEDKQHMKDMPLENYNRDIVISEKFSTIYLR